MIHVPIDPRAPALITPHTTHTYADLDQQVSALTARLHALGVQPNTVIAVLRANNALYLALIHALARLGAILLPLNTRLTPAELRYQVDLAQAALILTDAAHEPAARPLATPDRPVHLLDTITATSAQAVPTSAPPDLDAVQSIIFTSGTTGQPKAAQITFANLYHSALASAQRIGASPTDRWLCVLPFYHVGGLSILFRAALDGSSVILPDRTDTQSIMRAIHDQQATLVSLVPTQLYRMLQAGFTSPPSLRLILLGGAAASRELIDIALVHGIPIAPTYGLTEAASQVATLTPDRVASKRGSVGKPLDGITVRVIDANGRDLPSNHPGEIVVTGKTVMRGYLGHPPTNGTHHTGDIGYLDADGDLWLLNRRSDLIISGGENIYPSEVEAVLRQHPAVAEVVVVGIPHAEWGQQVGAAVQLKPDHTLTADELIIFARHHLAGYKQPRQILFVAEFPQTASGKVMRGAVADLFHKHVEGE